MRPIEEVGAIAKEQLLVEVNDRITGVGWTEDPPIITVYIEREEDSKKCQRELEDMKQRPM